MKRSILSAVFCCTLSCFAASSALADQRPFTAKDLATLDRVSDPRVSPDGRYVVYDLRTVQYDENQSTHSLWLADLEKGSAPRRLAASDGGATTPRWSPDGHWIYFTSGRAGGTQVWRTDIAGRQAAQVTKLPLDVGSFRIAPDGRHLVVSAAVFPDCADLACTKGRLDAKAASKATGVLYDKLFIRHWDEWADGTRNALWVLTLDGQGAATAAPVPLMKGFDGDAPTKPFGGDEDYAIAPDGASLVFSARAAGRTEPWSTNFDLFRVPLDGSKAPENLTPGNPAWDAGPVFSPDGTKLAWRAMKRPGFEADRYGIMVRDLKSGATREIDQGWDRSADSLAWSPDGKTLYTTADDGGQLKIFAVDAATGAVKPLTGDGHVASFDIGPKSIVYARGALDSPDQLYSIGLSGGQPNQITRHDLEQLAGVGFGAYEQFAFAGWNDETVHGYVVKPFGFKAGQKYPVAFVIHGGPQSSMANLFHYRWNPETLAGAGFAVVFIDFHGSPGYGQAFTDSISQHWGDRPLEDLRKGWEFALGKYAFLDGGRACALGGSYGGYMVNWIAGNWKEPFKCLIDHDGLFDNRMMAYSTEELWFSEWENGGLPWEKPENYERFNPVDHVANWSVPELVIHGGRDFRIPDEQGIAAFTALQRKGVPSEFLYFPQENHWVLKPQNSVQWYGAVIDWMRRWTGK
ncbi:MAG TPA: S9 family peptidase [Alphaproteobacteria bacterium]|nr:S9 family peptidase [Alphaproteobacteria bacterium]